MRTLYFCPVVSSIFFFPRLISAVTDWMSTILPHMVWRLCEFRMQVWNMLHAACWKCRIQKIAKNSSSAHHRITLSGHIFATKARIDNQKKTLLNSNISSTCPHSMVNFGPLMTEIGSGVWVPQLISTGFASAALLHSTLVVVVSQTLRRCTEGATYIQQGGHHIGHWPTF